MVLAQPLAVYRLGRVEKLRLHDGLGDLQESGMWEGQRKALPCFSQ